VVRSLHKGAVRQGSAALEATGSISMSSEDEEKRLLLVLESLKLSLDQTPTLSAYRCLSVAVVCSTF
jgi:hypothetical protein